MKLRVGPITTILAWVVVAVSLLVFTSGCAWTKPPAPQCRIPDPPAELLRVPPPLPPIPLDLPQKNDSRP